MAVFSSKLLSKIIFATRKIHTFIYISKITHLDGQSLEILITWDPDNQANKLLRILFRFRDDIRKSRTLSAIDDSEE